MGGRFMQKSLFAKYFSVCATLVIVSITILGAVFLTFASQYFKNDKYKLLQSNTERTVGMVQQYYEGTVGFDANMLKSYMEALSQTIDSTLFLTDANGKTIYCTEAPPARQGILSSLQKNGEYSEMGKLGGIYEERYYTFAMPVTVNGEIAGYLFTSSHASSQQQDFLHEMLRMFLFSSLAVLLITFIAVYFITLQMVKPLRQMASAAQKFGRGEFDTRLPVSGTDEMGQLAMAMNNMAQSLSTLYAAKANIRILRETTALS